MAIIDQIANGESGASVRGKLNNVHDQISEVSGATYTQLIADDIILYDATVAGLVALLPSATANKKLLIYNLEASTQTVTVNPDSAETIDGEVSATLQPGQNFLISPIVDGWEILGVTAGNGLTVDGQTVSIQTQSDRTSPVDTTQTLYVHSLDDLPNAIGNVISFFGEATLIIQGKVDLEDNLLQLGGGQFVFYNVQSANDVAGQLTSSHDLGTIRCTAQFLGVTNLFVENTGVDNIAIAIDEPTCTFFWINSSAADFSGTDLPLTVKVQQFNDFFMRDVLIRGVVNFETDQPDATVRITNSRFRPGINQAPIDSIEFFPGVTVAACDIIDSRFETTFDDPAIGSALKVATPDAIGFGTIQGNNYIGDGQIYQCSPGTNTSDITLVEVRSVGSDGVNLLGVGDPPQVVNRYVGMTDTIDGFVTPTSFTPDAVSGPRAASWYRGNLIVLDVTGNDAIFLQDGFSNTTLINRILTSLPSVTIGEVRCVTTDGTHLIFIERDTREVFIYDADDFFNPAILISALFPLDQYVIPGLGDIEGACFDGVNLIAGNRTDNSVHVMQGLTSVIQYTFPANSVDLVGIACTNTGFAEADRGGSDLILVNESSVTMDHSAKTWEIFNNTNDVPIIESSDRGGSLVSSVDTATPFTLPTVPLQIWADVSDVGVTDLVFFADFTSREKCRMNDETNGEMIWTGVRGKSRTLAGTITTSLAAGTTGDFEIAIEINGEIQTDSIGLERWTSNNEVKTLRTMPIARDIFEGDLIKIQKRQVDGGTLRAFEMYLAKLSIV